MKIIKSPEKLTPIIKKTKCQRQTIGFVPTMGALHQGHLSLIKQARKDNDFVAVSIFVNPAQFGPGEDLKTYPRPLRNDLRLCSKAKVDLVFLPDKQAMYPRGFSTFVNVEGLSNLLCGANRPGHFRAVATIVAKLINLVAPDTLYLGQKDAQQAIIISRMIKDLNFPVKVKVMPILRQKDGLALSSRNIHLNKTQKLEAVVLFKALGLAESLISLGLRDAGRIISRMKGLILKSKQAKIDYISIVDLETLCALKKINQSCLVALAVKFGKTRLIDNRVMIIRCLKK